MNTGQLVDTIAKKANLPKAQAKRVLATALDTITGEVRKGKKVQIAGFGTFERARRKARTGRNPQTGDTIKIAAKKFPKFRPGAAFKTAVHPSK